jgi:hypothetical protein
MPVVLVQPDRELLSTLIGIFVGSGIGPLVQGGLDQPLGLVIGAWPVRLGSLAFGARRRQTRAKALER